MSEYAVGEEFEYKGIKFRSKLIASWAIFFNEIGISYEYEPECFILDGDVKFIPTFKIRVYLPNYDEYETYFVVVTGDPLDSNKLDQINNLARLTNAEVMELEGPPDFVNYLIYYLITESTVTFESFTFDPIKYGINYTGFSVMLEPEDLEYQSQIKINAIKAARKLMV